MSIKRIFIAISAIFAASAVFADNSSVTSKKYVDDLMSGYQGKLPGSGANTLMIYDDETGIGEKSIEATLGANATGVPTVGAVKTGLDGVQDTITGTAGYVMTGMGTNRPGEVGERAIYSTSLYGNSLVTPQTLSSALVTAETVNNGVINAVNNSLRRVNENGDLDSNGTLWQISDDITALGICSDYAPATGTGVQNGTPTPTNPVLPTFYQDGNMILRAVGNYADSYDATTNKITRRVGVKVLDGTEIWVTAGSGASAESLIATAKASFAPDLDTSATYNKYMCSHFKVAGNDATNTLSITTSAYGVRLGLNTDITGDSTTKLANAKKWLADQYAACTPVVVYYPLATPVTEDMPPRCQ